MSKAKFKVDDRVNHPAAPDGSHPAGTGIIESVSGTSGDFTYTVKCDATGQVLKTKFKEADLSAV